MSGRRKKDIFMLPKATFVSIKGRRHFIAADIANSVEGLAGYCKDPFPSVDLGEKGVMKICNLATLRYLETAFPMLSQT